MKRRIMSMPFSENSSETPARQVNMKSGALEDTELSAVNKAFGRKFNIVSFRWLSPEEV